MLYVVTGGGGGDLKGASKAPFLSAARSVYHFVFVEVTPQRLVITAYRPDGTAFDHVELLPRSGRLLAAFPRGSAAALRAPGALQER